MRILNLVCILALAAALTGCGSDVRDINADPQEFDGQEISLEGTVKEVAAIPPTPRKAGMSLYLVCDGTGDGKDDSIWVVRGEDSEVSSTPFPDLDISLKGVIRAEMKIRQKTYGPVIVERSAVQEGLE